MASISANNADMGRRLKELEKVNADLGARLGDAESQLASSQSEVHSLTEIVSSPAVHSSVL